MEDVYIYLFAEWIAEQDFLAVEYYSALMSGWPAIMAKIFMIALHLLTKWACLY